MQQIFSNKIKKIQEIQTLKISKLFKLKNLIKGNIYFKLKMLNFLEVVANQKFVQ